jgi:hypothetical protein
MSDLAIDANGSSAEYLDSVRHPAPVLFARSVGDRATHFAISDGRRIRYVVPRKSRLGLAGLKFFANDWKTVFYKVQCLFGGYPRLWLAPNNRYHELLNVSQACEGELVVRLGTPGPYTKDTAVLIGRDGMPLSVAKVGCSDAAAALLTNEARWLRRLSSSAIAPHVPMLHSVSLEGRSCYLVQSASMPTGKAPGLERCLTFLYHLQQCDKPVAYDEGLMKAEMRVRFERLRRRLSPTLIGGLETALATVEHGLSRSAIAMVPAHGDFARWNMRMTKGRLLVFDWEYARAQCLPLYDLCHFLLMPLAVRRALTQEDARRTLSHIRELGSQLPRGCNQQAAAELQMLAYLADIVLIYLESRGGEDGGHVVRQYVRLIHNFALWRS